ncbi:MAG: GTPase Era [Pseudomonadota bacterium]
MSTENLQTRCGTIALIGAPNAGKSTLMNRMIGTKISIVTPKAQTTRSRVTGVTLEGESQLVFLDVPGVFDATQTFEKAMVSAAWNSARSADVVLFIHDARKKPTEETEAVINRIRDMGKPALIALNKVDALPDKKVLLERVVWFNERLVWQHIFLISARKGDGVDDMRGALAELMPVGPFLYDRDALTDMPMRLIASEMTREQCFLKLQEELPYTLTVENEKYDAREDGSVEIHQNIIVQNERQKTILIGKDGQMLKAIGERARHEIGRLLGARCHLYLFVKVRPDWKDKPESYSYLGLEFNK